LGCYIPIKKDTILIEMANEITNIMDMVSPTLSPFKKKSFKGKKKD